MTHISPIYTELTECQDCYKCIRQCPVKAIRVEDGHAMVVPELCILCGHCVIHCPAKAKHVRDDVPKTKQLFNLKSRVIVSLAPSFASEFPEFSVEEMIFSLKQLGFWAVSETAIGADLVSQNIAKELDALQATGGKQKLFISSACPASVEYIKQYRPSFAPYITETSSPLHAHARYLKEIYGDDVGIVFIGPCIAKKREADVWNIIDSALTFNDLRQWFKKEGLLKKQSTPLDKTKEDFIPFRAGQGSIYPIGGGMIDSLKTYKPLENIRSLSFTGIEQIRESLEGLHNESLKAPLFLELLACEGGCVNGPGTRKGSSLALKTLRVNEYAFTAADRLPETVFETERDLSGSLPIEKKEKTKHSEEDIRHALRSVGKYTREDELNCASCGYDTCRLFAEAMLDNRAEKTMCVSYMRKLAQKKANGLIRAIPGGVVIANADLKIIECNTQFASLIGPDIELMFEAKPGLEGVDLQRIIPFGKYLGDVMTRSGPDRIEKEVVFGKKIFHISVFVIEKESVAGAVIEDVTSPQIQKHRIVKQAKKVIDKNLQVVQKIAFLLGENAAESESILNSIINSFSEDEEEL